MVTGALVSAGAFGGASAPAPQACLAGRTPAGRHRLVLMQAHMSLSRAFDAHYVAERGWGGSGHARAANLRVRECDRHLCAAGECPDELPEPARAPPLAEPLPTKPPGSALAE